MFDTSIGIVGSGRVGGNLAYRLGQAGWHIKGIYDIDNQNALRVAKSVPTGVYPKLEMILNRCEAVIIATPDTKILEIADLISELRKPRARCLFHTSGVLPSRILRAAGAEFSIGSMHPAKPVPPLSKNNDPFLDANWTVEGDSESVELSSKMIESLGGSSMDIRSNKKAIYHAACALLSNHIFCILEHGKELLELSGLNEERIQKTIAELSGNAVKGFCDDGMNALTGALQRGDFQTVLEHIAALESLDDNRFAELYMATMAGLPNEEKIIEIITRNPKRK